MENATRDRRNIRWLIFFGALFLFLTFFKGDGGYHDLVYYMDDAQGLWLRGDMSRPDEFEEVDTPDGPVERPVYSQYSLGLAFIAGPFVWLGRGVEWLSSGGIDGRTVAALLIPVLGALSAVLLYEIGLELNVSARANLWAAIIFTAGTPMLTFTRLFYTETAVVFFLLLAIWSFLNALSAGSPFKSAVWSLLAGAGLAGAGACHYSQGVLVFFLWIGMAGAFFFEQKIRREQGPAMAGRVLNVVALSMVPILAVGALLLVNYLRRGHALDTGYGGDVGELSVRNIAYNWRYFFFAIETKLKLGLLVRNPWIPVGVLLLATWPHAASRSLRAALIAGALLQTLFWMTYPMLGFSPLRYLQSVTGALSVGLLCLGHKIDERWRGQGLLIVGILLVAWNCIFFFIGDDRNLALMRAPESGEWLMYSWYMRPFPPGISDGYGTPPGALQWFILGLLVLASVAAWTAAWRKISK
jgi:hypothetical protein